MTVRIPFDEAQDTHLVDLLDRDVLETHAGWLVYMRGVDYAAWDAAQQSGRDESLWSRLAARAQQHPADALDVYRRQLNGALQPADKRA